MFLVGQLEANRHFDFRIHWLTSHFCRLEFPFPHRTLRRLVEQGKSGTVLNGYGSCLPCGGNFHFQKHSAFLMTPPRRCRVNWFRVLQVIRARFHGDADVRLRSNQIRSRSFRRTVTPHFVSRLSAGQLDGLSSWRSRRGWCDRNDCFYCFRGNCCLNWLRRCDRRRWRCRDRLRFGRNCHRRRTAHW